MEKINQLIQAGVHLPNPSNVTIAEDVDLSRIKARESVFHPGTTIRGKDTFIAEGARIGTEGPVTVENCFVGPDVELKSGFFSGSVFLKKAVCGYGSHVRQGTILEEEASIAHTVGLKQTILFPFVTLGSLINFCDCLMAGGTDRKNHSEVGSSYIHFNFTPNQDKATPSIIGDVPRGVMMNQRPIFLGGQGGLVGPARIAYGTVLAAGTIHRMDQLVENQLVFGEKLHSGKFPHVPGIYHGLARIFTNNFNYIGNLYALRIWYARIRSLFIGSEMPQALFEGLKATLEIVIAERIRQLDKLAQKLSFTEADKGLRYEFSSEWRKIESVLEGLNAYEGEPMLRDQFIISVEKQIAGNGPVYLEVIKALTSEESASGQEWLESIVHRVATDAANCLPSLREKS